MTSSRNRNKRSNSLTYGRSTGVYSSLRGMSTPQKVGIGIVGTILGITLIVVLVAFCLALGALFYGALTLLIWNVLLHGLFGLGTVTFWQAMGIGLALTLISSIFSRNVTVTTR
jgi:ABC-type Co2+ transport system permease subunit